MINKVILMGRLTRDPELRHTSAGTPVCSFTIAVNNGYGENARTDFVSCTAWNKTAEFVSKYFEKGKMIIVVGRISTRSREDRDGKKQYITEVTANEVSFGESGRHDSGSYGSSYSQSAPGAPGQSTAFVPAPDDGDGFSVVDSDDDLPF